MGAWRNWYTRSIQNRVAYGLEGSSPSAPSLSSRVSIKLNLERSETRLVQSAWFGREAITVIDVSLG